MKSKIPTRAQAVVLASARRGAVQRCCYANHYPGGVTLTWCWVDLSTERKVTPQMIRTFENNGWAKVEQGALKEGAPVDPLQIAMGNWRLPDRLVALP